MSVHRNPPSFVLIEKDSGRVVYTKGATGVGSEAIAACVKKGRELTKKTQRVYTVFLALRRHFIGEVLNVPMIYHMGITEEIGPQGSAMPSGRKCCSAPDVRSAGQGMECMNCRHWEADNYLKNPNYRARFFAPDMKSRETRIRARGIKEALKKAHAHAEKLPKEFTAPRSSVEVDVDDVRKNIFTFNNPPSGPADETAARELELYIDNDSQLYHSQFVPIVKNLMMKRRKGTYDREKAITLFMYLMDAGAKKYVSEFGTRGQKIDAMFNRNTRLRAARAFRDSFETEAELGNYDRLIGSKSGRIIENPKTIRCSCGTRIELDGYDEECPKCGRWYNAFGQALKPPSEWSEESGYEDTLDNPKRVRKNIFTFNNPRKLNTMEQAAAAAGLSIATWAPGDGSTRYRFFKAAPGGRGPWADYHQGDALYTAMGRKDAMSFIVAYQMGRKTTRENPPSKSLRAFRVPRGYEQRVERLLRNAFIWAQAENGQVVTFARPEIAKRAIKVVLSGQDLKNNPLTRAEAGQELRFAREAMQRMADAQRSGVSGASDFGYAQGIAGVVGRRGTRAAARSAERVMRHVRYNPSPIDPPGLAELDARMNDLMRKMDAMKKAKTDNGPEYMILLKEAQAVSKERLKLIGLGSHSIQEGFTKRVRPNPLLQTVLLANPGSVKTFNEMQGVGKAKYVVNYHDGVKTHRDGSPFFDIAIFSSQAKKDRFVRELESRGFTRGSLRNPPISTQWDHMTRRQREALLEIVGYDRDYSGGMTMSSWKNLSPSAKHKLEAQWLDTTSSGGTTKRRRVPVAVNPLTRTESARILKRARLDLRHGSSFRPGHTKSERSGQAHARAQVVRVYGPQSAGRAAMKIADRAQKMAGTVISNPGIKFPKPGTRMTVAQAMELARKIGDRDLIKQCQEAAKLQTKANRGSKCVIWKILPIGSKSRIDMVTAFAHYGDSPEDMYKPPKGSKKGPHMYRHKWGEGTGKQKPVPVLAAPGGKAIIKVMGPGQKVGDWMRG